jgi:hypothetical protein
LRKTRYVTIASGNKGGVIKIAQPMVSDKGLPFLRVSLITQITATSEIVIYTARTTLESRLFSASGKISSSYDEKYNSIFDILKLKTFKILFDAFST